MNQHQISDRSIEGSQDHVQDGMAGRIVDRFLVCGLGSLGQYCVLNLRRFAKGEAEVQVVAIDRVEPLEWEVSELLELLAEAVVVGDCRNEAVLERAGVRQCRAILLVTADESVNIEAAIAARRLHPNIRLVVRSARQNLNELLRQRLGNFVALEPTELPAPAFALSGLKAGILGFFDVGEYRLQVVQQSVAAKDYRFDGAPMAMLHKRAYRVLSLMSDPVAQGDQKQNQNDALNLVVNDAVISASNVFYRWHPWAKVKAGDTIAYVEVIDQAHENAIKTDQSRQSIGTLLRTLKEFKRGQIRQGIEDFWRWLQAQQTRMIISIGLVTAAVLWAIATVMLKQTIAGMTWQRAMSAGGILLLGGYGDLFGGLTADAVDVPGWVQFVSFSMTLVSFLFVLGVFGLITNSLLSSRLDFLKKRPAIPVADHVVLVGFGRVGQRIAQILRQFRQAVVVIADEAIEPQRSPFPILIGQPIQELSRVNLQTAKSLIAVTADELVNLEIALMARNVTQDAQDAQARDRQIRLVVRSYSQRFSDNLAKLLPDVKILAAYALSAEAFVGAAFGENILGLFRLHGQTILVTEYRVTAADTLVDRLLAEVAYGYGVVPIFHQSAYHSSEATSAADLSDCLMPSDDRRLRQGDRLVVLSSINGLRRIERGERATPRRWKLQADKPLNQSFVHYCGNDLARIAGLDLATVRSFMERLPGAIELDLYDHQAHRLVQEMSRQLPMTLTPLK